MDTNIGKSIFFTSASTIILAVLTLVFWLLIARIAGAEAIGITNAIISLGTIIVTVDVLNTHLGMKRYLGIAKSAGDLVMFKQIIVSTLSFVSITVAMSAVIIAIPGLQIMEIAGIDRQYIWIVIAIIPALAFNNVLPEVLIAAHLSKNLATALLISSLTRFPILVAAIYILNVSLTIATMVAYSSALFLIPVICLIYLRNILRKPLGTFKDIKSNISPILGAGMASWIPTMISVVGSQLGIITVLSVEGGAEAGKFYLPLTIFGIALFVVNGINRVSHPLVAGMDTEEEKTKFVSYFMNIAFIFTMPVAVPLLYFSNDFLRLIGPEFSSADATLTILMMGLPLSIICEIVYYYVYGIGDRKAVLGLGLAGNVPRIFLYLALVPIMGAKGAALAYVIGSLFQLVYSLSIAKNHSLAMHYRKYLKLTGIPLTIGGIVWLIDLQFLAATAIIISGSLLLYIQSRLFTDKELRNVLYTGFPLATANKVYPTLSTILRRIPKMC